MIEYFNKQEAAYFSVEEYTDHFKKCWKNLKRNFFKYESLQTYSEPNNPAFVAFEKGDWSTCKLEVFNFISSQYSLFESALQNGISLTRIRKVELPLSNYLKFEFEAYKVISYFGERIGLIKPNHKQSIKELEYFTDFVLFDNQQLFVLDYNAKGLLEGAWFVNHQKDVNKFNNFADKITKKAIPFGEFLKTMSDSTFNSNGMDSK
ncbi:MAG: hypothetical protein UT42_C0044G0011 [Candidatus Falkowbacteria bacterium GW2011_GWA2_39_24]|uniref:DUF6879 domain-containing protein n=1 Tax=Candidatus Falkowbacteria bacterium GW2011_GWA2_39_24 TaxID=1618634 RepID=A0A0G0RJ02_9BACT|nr:MAG: hypothetical protein UT42_C0044G0011 [Candidatus Falkowbacteria bacterium GW2011_GWA2_39_24]